MTKPALDPPRLRSERELRASQGWPLWCYGIMAALSVVQLAWLDDSRGQSAFSFARLAVTVFFVATIVFLAFRFREISSWRQLPVEPGERLLWGTFAERVLPSGGAAYPGRLALSTTRLRYLPDPVSRLRGATADEWPAAALHDVRITPVDGRRRRRGGRWVMVDVDGRDPITLLTSEAHLVADELFEALRVAAPSRRD